MKTASYSRTLLLIALSFLCAPAVADDRHAASVALRLPLLSSRIPKFYSENPETSETRLLPEYRTHTVHFDAHETAVSIKGDHFGKNTVDTDTAYYEAGHFEAGGYTYRLVVYEGIGESDTPLLNTLLIGYDGAGGPTDALLLDSRFSYEEMQKYSDFVIDPETVHIDCYVIQTHDIVDGGEIGDRLEQPIKRLHSRKDYRIENGRFILISPAEGREVEHGN
ncbi:MAG: hypothetical protein LBL59_01735 [Xanthomonadaceae bacterium]|jgi:hypothetical protein|nr:hypothetical protein [Xanthomonadaceae bacterium]